MPDWENQDLIACDTFRDMSHVLRLGHMERRCLPLSSTICSTPLHLSRVTNRFSLQFFCIICGYEKNILDRVWTQDLLITCTVLFSTELPRRTDLTLTNQRIFRNINTGGFDRFTPRVVQMPIALNLSMSWSLSLFWSSRRLCCIFEEDLRFPLEWMGMPDWENQDLIACDTLETWVTYWD